ncbi:MAG: hypothetical protein K2N51_05095 [Lachnospiraceae bacterium]|nr:hypothetical protein [Lachnospiraceae bacterium]
MDSKVLNYDSVSLIDLFDIQAGNQREMLKSGMYVGQVGGPLNVELPMDSVSLSSYHIQQLISEIGEMLDADKRWKSHRNVAYDASCKLEEIADCFIVMMNIAMFSGFDGKDVTKAIIDKLDIVSKRIE